ncbi:hypothetical protein GS399_10170 [Pedobacter sp. HMF7647]|uniref:DUF3108 domain-containing protein n=1 Tax=Hufsiella arboris TaxID=2695275 RepID=A0A7K1Y9T7_9SPHI|nr:hypothetical protein [Hufsiella arboris]MXV51334.1 hypothetical protein [Hufsiella arboris]
MRLLTLFLSFLLSLNSFAQLKKLKGSWVSHDQEFLLIKDTTLTKNINGLSNAQLRDQYFELEILGDTLSFQQRYTSSRTNFKQLHIDRYDFKISKLTDSNLIIRPVSKFSKQFFPGKSELVFRRQEFTVDSTWKFEKITFHTTTCMGNCRIYHLQIDSTKAFKLRAPLPSNSIPLRRSIVSQDRFTGSVSDSLYDKLIFALKTSNLRTLKMNEVLCCDAPELTIIVHFNGQRRYFKTMFPPLLADNLVRTLYSICENQKGMLTDEKFDFEY